MRKNTLNNWKDLDRLNRDVYLYCINNRRYVRNYDYSSIKNQFVKMNEKEKTNNNNQRDEKKKNP